MRGRGEGVITRQRRVSLTINCARTIQRGRREQTTDPVVYNTEYLVSSR